VTPRTRRSQVSHERWLVSYADFITLLLAFFVVLYAFAKTDEKNQAQVPIAIDTAFHELGVFSNPTHGPAKPVAASSGALPTNAMTNVITEDLLASAQVREDLDRVQRELEQRLSQQIARRTVDIHMGRGGLVISLREAGFFDSGSADPRPGTVTTLRQIGILLGRTPFDVRVEGHTDNIPIHTGRFDSNWELSAARATRIARIFLDSHSIPAERLSAAGYAEYHPVASNATAEGRAKNRRVDLVILPRTEINFAASGSPSPRRSWHKITDDDPQGP